VPSNIAYFPYLLSVLHTPGVYYHTYTRPEPVGVVGQIIAWNFPLLMAAWKLAPALACGRTQVLKVAEETPLSALRLGESMQAAGLPSGVVNIVTGFDETAGAALASHTGIDKIAFTGTTEVGRMIVKAAANDLKKVSLELGGKSPDIVLSDADMDIAIPGAMNAIFFNQGECCAAGLRLFVDQKVFDQVVEGIAEEAKQIKVGPGLDPKTQLRPWFRIGILTGSPAISTRALWKTRAVAGGKKGNGKGYFIEPTTLVDTKPGMKVVDEEIFGPVVVATPFNDMDDELVRQANNTIYGLASGIWTAT